MPASSSPDVVLRREWVLFDVDGTLVDHGTAQDEAITGWILDRGFPPEVDGVPSPRLWRDIAQAAFVARRAGRLTCEEQRRRRVELFLPRMGVDVRGMDGAELDAQFQEYLERYRAAWRPFPDVVECLARLRETCRLAVLSNGEQGLQEDKLRRSGLEGYVEAVLTSSRLGAAKPDPRAFVRALARLGGSVRTASYVGDRLDLDARAATAAGLTGVWLNRRAADPADLDVPMVRTLARLRVARRAGVLSLPEG